MTAPPRLPPVRRREALREALPSMVDLIARRRAVDIEVGYIDECVALNWLEWNGGALCLTTAGNAVCEQVMHRFE